MPRQKPLKELLQQIHRTDQILAQVRDFPEILRKFYEGLKAQNFTKLESVYLTSFLSPTLWVHAFGMPAIVMLNGDDLVEELEEESEEFEYEDAEDEEETEED